MTATPAQFLEDTAKAALADIDQLKLRADEILQQEFQGIADAARNDDAPAVSLRLKRRNTLEELVNASTWLSKKLIDVLLKVASGEEPHPVMASDLSRRIHEAEIRLELLREMNRK